ncbi:purine and uridine phosphorylase [Aspergillus avenaceus]|uniref:Purine and uridine phosphorylase n=1 Tax=Aspergillus avenaceus TaxID=36643 RepID=A0A5N6TFK2_ASPAV|nr:purine and uridine phosphorylase [Aspergillus avenaceus]
MSEPKSLPNDDYTIGWIAALHIERAAAEGMLEEKHGPQQFNIVIAGLPDSQVGSSPAASVAKSMLFTFPNIRVGLMVGIGGGIPENDENSIDEEESIRLGDVVISSDKATGGVIAYDFGKLLADGSIQQAYALNRPPESISAAVGKLRAKHERYDNKIPDYIEEMLKRYPKMEKKWTRPDPVNDRLFRAEYTHKDNILSCESCDQSQIIDRMPREEPSPVIHYGIIASGNAEYGWAWARDELRNKYQAICIETEAAGLMNVFPCIFIRGISDYADSHKNDMWQRYAAATAAACAKELLEHLPPHRAEICHA